MDISLNDEQRAAVTAPKDAHIRIVACPGSGKSRCLVARVDFLLSNDVPPENIKVVTFSRQAVADISKRVVPEVDVQTIHAMARRYELACFSQDPATVLGCLLSTGGEEAASHIKSQDDFEVEGASGPFVSVDEHIYRFKRMLENEEGLKRVKALGVPEFLLVDEFQDLCALQFAIVQLLAQRFRTRVFAVGDKNQNIYGFRKSSSAFLDSIHTLPHFECLSFHLTLNYRSTPALVLCCNSLRPDLLSDGKTLFQMTSARNGTVRPVVAAFSSKNREMEWVLDRILTGIFMGGQRACNIAVISRTQKECFAYCHKLVERGVPARMLLGDSAAEAPNALNCVSVCTMHGSKGLEWDSVIVTGCSDFYNRMLMTAEDLRQERNLFYVAATRAKNSLCFTSPARQLTRLLSKVPRDYYDCLLPDPKKGILTPVFVNTGTDPFVRSSRSVTHFVYHAGGEVYAGLKEAGLVSETYPDATLLRVHAPHSNPAGGQDNACLYATLIERVIYRQMDLVCRKSLIKMGAPEDKVWAMKSMDNHANACFMYVVDPASSGNTPQEELQRMAKAVADRYNLSPDLVKVCDESAVPAYVKARDVLYGPRDPYRTFFDARMDRIRASYGRYVLNRADYCTKEGLQDIFDVSLCAHLAYAPAKTHLLFSKEEFDYGAYAGLFHHTLATVAGFFEKSSALSVGPDINVPEVAHTDFYLNALGVGFDVDLSVSGLYGVADIIVNTTIVEIKCSVDSRHSAGIQMPWILQLMIYAALARRKGLKIDSIAVYNPLRGLFWMAPIGHWTKHNELLDAVIVHLSGDVGAVNAIA